jgi:hypothetical protein
MSRILNYRRVLLYGGCWIIAACLLGIAMWRFGHMQMGGFDHSALVDTAWRMVNHQQPYRDFYLTTPIAFYLGAGLAFSIWGVKWSALVWVAIVYALVTFLLMSISFASFAPPQFSIGLPLTCEILAMGVASFWWYNSITAVTACVFIAAAVVLARRPSSWRAISMFALATFLLLMMKPNIAGLLGVLVVGVLASLREMRRRLFIALAVSVAALIALLAALGISPLEVVRNYMEIARTRGLPSVVYFTMDKPGEAYVTIPFIVLCLLPVAHLLKPIAHSFCQRPARRAQVPLICAVGVLTGGLAMFTNSDSNLAIGIPLMLISGINLTLWLVREGLAGDDVGIGFAAAEAAAVAATLIGMSLLGLYRSPDIRQVLWGICLFGVVACVLLGVTRVRTLSVLMTGTLALFACVGLIVGNARLRVKYVGPSAFYTDGPLVEIPDVPFFDRFLVSPELREVVGEIEDALARFAVRPDDPLANVYFGPRIEFAYAAFGLPSPKHLPVWYHPGVSYPEDAGEAVVQAYLASDFRTAIFLRVADNADFLFLPSQITEFILSNYQRVDYPGIIVFTRKPG